MTPVIAGNTNPVTLISYSFFVLGPTPRSGCVNLIVDIFCHKLHEDERNWTEMGSVSVASPIGSTTAMNTGLRNEKIEIH